MQANPLTYIYLLPILVIVIWYWRRHARHEQQSLAALKAATEAGMLEPPTLHPEINQQTCIGCKSCVMACPEQDSHVVLGMIGKKARLVGPSDCIGHGACKTVCPVGAITLVFGTARRGVDIPVVNSNFETDVSGVFIAGELGGMGLIKNAVEQGRQAMQSIKELVRAGHSNQLDVAIIGAGPAGFASTLAAKEANLSTVTIEQEELGGTVAHFPRRKLVMTQPADLPIFGKMKFKEVQKEDLIEFWRDVELKTAVKINYNERVDKVEPAPDGKGFTVTTNKTSYDVRAVLIAIGRRGSPRQLGVPGEDLPKVVYRLIDAEQYQHKHVLVVGGGDSALEAATSIADEPGTSVDAAAAAGNLRVLFNSNVKAIHSDSVDIAVGDKLGKLKNDFVIVSAGGILPTGFLKTIGINVETKWGTE